MKGNGRCRNLNERDRNSCKIKSDNPIEDSLLKLKLNTENGWIKISWRKNMNGYS